MKEVLLLLMLMAAIPDKTSGFLNARVEGWPIPKGRWTYTVCNSEAELFVSTFQLQRIQVPVRGTKVPEGWRVFMGTTKDGTWVGYVADSGYGVGPGDCLGGFELDVPAADASVDIAYILTGVSPEDLETMNPEEAARLGRACWDRIPGPGCSKPCLAERPDYLDPHGPSIR